MLVSICVTTYKRPEGLRRLLTGLAKLKFKKVKIPTIEVIIIDNYIQGITSQICKEFEQDFPWRLKTDVESKRGITYGRNKALSLTNPQTDAIAILDDDEVPVTYWLDELLWALDKYKSDVVTGTVLPHFIEGRAPEWIIKGGFFNPPRYKTGDTRHVAFTNNVLVKAEALKSYNPVFDNRFALTGGEDSHLFMRLHQAGHKIVWADEAIVHDWIPSDRTKPKWVLERHMHMWSIYSLLEKELYPSFITQFIRVVKGLGLILIGIFSLPFSLVFGRKEIFKALIYVYKGIGTFIGLLEINRQFYKNVNTG